MEVDMASRIVMVFSLSLILAFPAAADEKDDVGTIEVRSEAEGALVYLEGFPAGRTPATLTDLPEGGYRVVVRSESSGDYVEDVTVAKGKTTTVNATLPSSGFRSPSRAEDDYQSVSGKDARKPYEKATSKKKLRDYKVLEISNFLTKSEKPVAPEYLYSLFHDMASQLEEKTEFGSFVTNYTRGPSARWVAQDPPADAPTLVLSGVITEYEPGNQTTRYMVGFGAGKTRAYCLFRITDKATGEVLLERMENGSVSMGLFGGSSSGAMKELGEDIAKAIRANW
jgi:hypothetical protein